MLTHEQQQHCRAWLMLSKVPRVGTKTFLRLIDGLGSPAEVLAAPTADLIGYGLPSDSVKYLRDADSMSIDADLRWAEDALASIITLDDPRYPSNLREIPDPPPVLYVYGQIDALQGALLAMVGSRSSSISGKETASAFAHHLAKLGFTIVSGLALGIDAACHQGALDAGGCSIAVAGTGLDRVYPARHQQLAHQLIENGLLISEFPIGTAPAAGNFPRRNRIISGLSLGVIVVEAAIKSGSLITARLAMEQGREVFAVPGSIHNSLSKGCNLLIRQGAKLIETAEHVLEEYSQLAATIAAAQPQLNSGFTPAANTELGSPPPDSQQQLDADYQNVLNCLGFEPTSVDTVIQRCGLKPDIVCSILLVLELRGFIITANGGGYARAS